ncbi:hypothetical protein BJ508DRAFT_39683 [Ascobolus immersus RN42]|uniref:Uncharacterized protein n=1 Tax=Ascobolus immersus RN42 TaxID=1160509 RepID=A0A3N4HNV9_ASCIM|nr:hypothetical protein BJ508DRAFT_39683 [Ascobolus immersus RN42]
MMVVSGCLPFAGIPVEYFPSARAVHLESMILDFIIGFRRFPVGFCRHSMSFSYLGRQCCCLVLLGYCLEEDIVMLGPGAREGLRLAYAKVHGSVVVVLYLNLSNFSLRSASSDRHFRILKMKLSFQLPVILFALSASPALATPITPATATFDAVDNRLLPLSVSTIQHLDALVADLQPRLGHVVDFGLPKYQILYDHYLNGTYVPRGFKLNGNPQRSRNSNYARPISIQAIEEGKRTCTLSGSSPDRNDAYDLVDWIDKFWYDKKCDQSNLLGGSWCTTIAKNKSVGFGLCGDYSRWNIPCIELTDIYYRIIQLCNTSCRTGSCQAAGKTEFVHEGGGRIHREEATIFPSWMG